MGVVRVLRNTCNYVSKWLMSSKKLLCTKIYISSKIKNSIESLIAKNHQDIKIMNNMSLSNAMRVPSSTASVSELCILSPLRMRGVRGKFVPVWERCLSKHPKLKPPNVCEAGIKLLAFINVSLYHIFSFGSLRASH